MQRSIVKALFWALVIGTLLSLAALGQIDPHLRTPAAPSGIVSFELCAYSQSCSAIMQSWDAQAKQMAALSLGLDYLFLLLYSALIFTGLRWLAMRARAPQRRFLLGSAWLAWVAGLADALENYCLAQMLLHGSVQTHAWPAAILATLKFTLLAYTLGCLVIEALVYGWGGRQQA